MQNAIFESERLALPNRLSTLCLHSRKIVWMNQALPVLVTRHSARRHSIDHLLLRRPRYIVGSRIPVKNSKMSAYLRQAKPLGDLMERVFGAFAIGEIKH